MTRFFFFTSICFILFSFLIWRLVDLQIMNGPTYLAKAEANRVYTERLPALRGILLDRYGQPLVWNVQRYFEIQNPGAQYETKVPLTRDEALHALASTQSANVIFDTQRQYRYPNALAHVVGYVGSVTADDLRRDDSLSASQQIGKAGLELFYEKQLRGIDGKALFEVNAVGQKLRKVGEVTPQAGMDIQTSLDPQLTQVAADALGDFRGTVIITDAQTGQILALTSRPTFDPNVMSQVQIDKNDEAARQDKIRTFFADPFNVFFNRAISGTYPPGSIFKMAATLAGLETGQITELTTVDDQGVMKVGGQEFGNWYYRQYGKVEGVLGTIRAIARSNDTFFYKVAEWVGPDKLAEWARVFGYGQKTGVDLPAESAGLMPDPAWKAKYKGEKWFLGDTYHIGIGQGDILATPIQLAQVTQAVANNGQLCRLSLNASLLPQCRQVNVQEANINLLLKGMVGVCSTGGTAFPFFPYNAKRGSTETPKGISDGQVQQMIDSGVVACKTGTAEFGAANDKGARPTHGWLTAIVGLPDTASASAQLHYPKRLTITVLVESDDKNPYKEGSKDAAPIARKIVDWIVGVK